MPAGLAPEEQVLEPAGAPDCLPEETIEIAELSIGGPQGIQDASFEIRLDAHLALLGLSTRQSEALARCLVRLDEPEHGTIRIGGRNLNELPHSVVGRLFAYVASDARFFSGALLENLLYATSREEDAEDSRREAMRCLGIVGMAGELERLGLGTVIDPARHGDLASRLVELRRLVREQLAAGETQLVDFLEAGRYCRHASLGVNLLWGEPLRPDMDMKRLSEHPRVLRALEAAGLLRDLLRLGERAARALVEDGIPELVAPSAARTLVREDERADVHGALARLRASDARRLSHADKRALLAVALRLVAARHPFCPIDAELQSRVTRARRAFAERLPDELREQTAFFDAAQYNSALSVRENLLFGVLVDERSYALERLDAALLEELRRQDLLPRVAEIGLDFDVGVGGSRLRTAERQRLAIARALLRAAPVTVLDHPLGELDEESRRSVLAAVRTELSGRCLVCMLDDVDIAHDFEEIVAFRAGRVADRGETARARPDAHGSPAC